MKNENKFQDQVEEFCEEARNKNHVDILRLSYILGCDDQYDNKTLVDLWENCGMFRRLSPPFYNSFKMDENNLKQSTPSDVKDRIRSWFLLLERMTKGIIAGIKFGGYGYNYGPPLEKLDEWSDSDWAKLPDMHYGRLLSKKDVISLDDLKYYFKDQLRLPLPSRLFPNEQLPKKSLAAPAKSYDSSTIEDEVNKIIEEYCDDIDIFWECLKRKAKAEYGSIDAVGAGIFYDFAMDVFDENPTKFRHLKKNHIDDKDFYSQSSERRRRVIGNILLKIVTDICPQSLSRSSAIDTTIEGLFKKFKKKL